MLNLKNIRAQFPILKQKINDQNVVYFNNASTTLKPQVVINEVNACMIKYTANYARGDFLWGKIITQKIEQTRKKIATFINADHKEVIFTFNLTYGMNDLCRMLASLLNSQDEVILNKAEHSSAFLPWLNLSHKKGCSIVFAQLEKDYSLSLKAIKQVVTSKTKVIVFAGTTNVIGETREIKKICDFATSKKIITIVDGTQYFPTHQVDVKNLNCDFFLFSGHKVYGPSGIAILYGKHQLLKLLNPSNYGGGMNYNFDHHKIEYKPIPYCFEAGSPNFMGILGLGKACWWLERLGLARVQDHLYSLKTYCSKKLASIPLIKVYNSNVKSSIVVFSFADLPGEDVANFLASKGIACRAGDQCSKLLFNQKNLVRISFAVYNTKKEVDYLYQVLVNKKPSELII